MSAKIIWSSDVDIQGSGYGRLTTSMASRLTTVGHEVRVLGNGYQGQPHDFPFVLAPSSLGELRSQVEMIKQRQWPDLLVFAWDIPAQRQLTEWFAQKGIAKYIGLFPIEAGPLKEIEDWVGYIRAMDHGFVISEFGLRECQDAGLTNVSFLPVGIDHEFWQPLSPEARDDLRRDLNLQDKFVILSVGDNHLRKNHAASIHVIAKLKDEVANAHLIVIARPHARFIGWSLKELAQRYGVLDHVTIVHSRPSNEMLLRFYQAADAYYCPSHAEGLGLPILEAQACGLPVVAGGWTAMGELLACGRGIEVGYEYAWDDAVGNQRRFAIDEQASAEAFLRLYHDANLRESIAQKAVAFAQTRTFERAVEIFEQELGI